MFKREVTNAKFNEIINKIYVKPEADVKGAVKKWENKIDLVNELYFNSPTNANIKGTAWSVLNTLTERLDYYRTARKGNSDSLMAGASGFDPVLTAEKNKLKKMVLAMTA